MRLCQLTSREHILFRSPSPFANSCRVIKNTVRSHRRYSLFMFVQSTAALFLTHLHHAFESHQGIGVDNCGQDSRY